MTTGKPATVPTAFTVGYKSYLLLLYRRELVLTYRAKRTLEIVRKFLEWCTCWDASLW